MPAQSGQEGKYEMNTTTGQEVAAKFLHAVCGDGSYQKFMGVKGPHGFSNVPVARVDEAVARAFSADASGKDAYFACAQFANADSRKGENAVEARSFWLDLDCGPGKPYANQKEAGAALTVFCKSAGLPAPTHVVSSGAGLHVYWALEAPVPATEWKGYASKLKVLTHHHKLAADDSRTDDIASVLRVPGTRNWKKPDAPKPVRLLRGAFPIRQSDFLGRLENAYQMAGSPALRSHGPVRAVESGDAVQSEVVALCEVMARKHADLWDGSCLDVAAPELAGDKPAFVGQGADRMEGVRAPMYQGDRTRADCEFCNQAIWEAARLGVPEERLAPTVWAAYQCGAMFLNDDDQEDRSRKILQYALPKQMDKYLARRGAAVAQAEAVQADTCGELLSDTTPGDVLAGRYYARAAKGKLKYCRPRGLWMHFDGLRWVFCEAGEEMRFAKRVADAILERAAKLFAADQGKHGALLSFAKKLQNLPRMLAMVEMAKSEEGMTVATMSALDSDPWLLGVRNGVANLKTGELLQADPAMLITRQAAAEYSADAECPAWQAFLDQIFSGDGETVAFLQRACGYSLSGVVTEEVLFICHGYGANGKSVFANVLMTIMADYAQAAPSSLLTVRSANDTGARNDLARLCGARMLGINETQSGDRLDEQIVKQIAGRELISARFLHKEYFDFWPTAKPWLRTNHKPIITGEDDGIWRRLMLIPFSRKFAEHERDPYLEQKLLAERDGILAWMVRGCLDWQKRGLKPSRTVRADTATYRKDSDLLGEFLEDRTALGNDDRTEQSALFAAYRNWHEAGGTRAGSKASLTRKMKERGFSEARSNGKRYYMGLHLVPASG